MSWRWLDEWRVMFECYVGRDPTSRPHFHDYWLFVADQLICFHLIGTERKVWPLHLQQLHRRHVLPAWCVSTAARTCGSDWNRTPCPEAPEAPAEAHPVRADSAAVAPVRRRPAEPVRPMRRRRRDPPDRPGRPNVGARPEAAAVANWVWWPRNWKASVTFTCHRRPVPNFSPTATRSARGKLSTNNFLVFLLFLDWAIFKQRKYLIRWLADSHNKWREKAPNARTHWQTKKFQPQNVSPQFPWLLKDFFHF